MRLDVAMTTPTAAVNQTVEAVVNPWTDNLE